MGKVVIGSLAASVDGDLRYTDILRVEYDAESDTVEVTVSSTGAAGGMDSRGGATESAVEFRSSCPADPRAVLGLVRGALGQRRFNFKRYGRPAKRFAWRGAGSGVSLALCEKALDLARRGA